MGIRHYFGPAKKDTPSQDEMEKNLTVKLAAQLTPVITAQVQEHILSMFPDIAARMAASQMNVDPSPPSVGTMGSASTAATGVAPISASPVAAAPPAASSPIGKFI